MVVKPKDCLEPTEADYENRNKLCDKIDSELKSKFISRTSVVHVYYSQLDFNTKVISLVLEAYSNEGWKVETGIDAYYDPRDMTVGGGTYLKFSV